jgi:hypothetical protein
MSKKYYALQYTVDKSTKNVGKLEIRHYVQLMVDGSNPM